MLGCCSPNDNSIKGRRQQLSMFEVMIAIVDRTRGEELVVEAGNDPRRLIVDAELQSVMVW